MRQDEHERPYEDSLRPEPRICACLCTHNGSATIGECLDSLARQDLDPQLVSILVIDDGSTDHTADLVREWRDRHPHLNCRLVVQPAEGLSAARNVALRLSDARLVAFLDDDAVAEAGWLAGLLAAFGAFPEAVAVGGAVSVRWVCDKPRWWRDDLDEVFNRFRPVEQPCTLDWPRLPYGCNFAVRRSAAVGLGGFRTDLGRQRGKLLAGEETELFLRILATGYQVAYWPAAKVEHVALPDRLTRRYVLRRAWFHGRSLARLGRAYPRVDRSMPPLGRCFWRMLWLAPRYRFRLAHWKYWLLRLGYHCEAGRGARAAAASGRAVVPRYAAARQARCVQHV